MQPFTAVLTYGRVVVPQQSEADSLMNDGFGARVNGLLMLEPIETLFNVERGKITVVDEKNNRGLSFSQLLRFFLNVDPKLWTRFQVYRDLRTRGFVTQMDSDGLTDLQVFERGSYKKGPPGIRVVIFSEGSPENLDRLLELGRRLEKEGLQLKLAVVDRRGEMVYYSLSECKFGDVLHQPI